MKLLELLQSSTQYLTKHGVESPRLTMELILAHVLKKTRMELYLSYEEEILEPTLAELRPLVKQRAERIPLEYILGFKEFDGHRFKVTPDVLIPRPETEILFQSVIRFIHPELTDLPLVDVGTGSGVLAISIARKFPQLSVVAIDQSEKALAIARENGNGITNLQFLQSDLLAAFDGKAQMIVANLPYIPRDTISKLAPEVRAEPLSALDGGEDGLDFIRRLIGQSAGRTHYLALEIGDHQMEPVKSLFKDHAFEVTQMVEDFGGMERIIIGRATELNHG